MGTERMPYKKSMLTIILTFAIFCTIFFVCFTAETYADSTYIYGIVNNGPLNLRSNAGTQYQVMGKITKGTAVIANKTVSDRQKLQWYRIKFNSKNVFICAKYVNIKYTLTKYSTAKKGSVKKAAIAVRSTPFSSGKKLGTLKKNKSVSLQGLAKSSKGKSWYKITYNKKTAYIYKSYIALKSTAKNTTVNYSPSKKGTVIKGPLTVRSGPATTYSAYGSLAEKKTAVITALTTTSKGEKWYKTIYNNKTAYISAAYVALSDAASDTGNTSDFEAYMTKQGFPAVYKPYLRKLHKSHPKWVFKAQKTGLTWSAMLAKEKRLGNNLVETSAGKAWKSTRQGAYNSTTKKYYIFDGKWNQASDKAIAYYLDPRNFLNETSIYQFMGHQFKAASQTTGTVRKAASGSFMDTTSYASTIYTAGKNANVNPNVLTAMIIMEQGWRGTSGLISGSYSGYKGYYNFFNIGAWTTSSMSSTQRGLWYAKGEGHGYTSYNRPWNSRLRAIQGGAMYYGEKYVKKKQYTYYTKKFNVMNGLSNVAQHEYMTNISGADSEGRLVKAAYKSNDNYPITFYIPVYSGMPSSACKRP